MFRWGLVAAALLAVFAGTARAASAPLPPMSSFVLAPSDFRSGAVVWVSTQTTVSGKQVYVRVFRAGAKLGTRPLATAVSVALVEPDASTAQFDFSEFHVATKTKSGRQAVAQQWAVGYVKGLKIGAKGKATPKIEKLVVGAPITIGAAGMLLPMSVKTNTATVHMSMIVADVDRVVSVDLLMGEANAAVSPADSRAALAAIQKRLTTVFTVANTAPPTISGTAAAGQTLSADAGSWNGVPSSFTYSWSRCDTAGASCQPIAGATSSTYQVASADAGSTLVVTATGTNSVGSASATSAHTAAVGS